MYDFDIFNECVTDQPMEQPADQPTDQRTQPIKEMRGRILKQTNHLQGVNNTKECTDWQKAWTIQEIIPDLISGFLLILYVLFFEFHPSCIIFLSFFRVFPGPIDLCFLGSGPEGADDLCYHTGELSPSSSLPSPSPPSSTPSNFKPQSPESSLKAQNPAMRPNAFSSVPPFEAHILALRLKS